MMTLRSADTMRGYAIRATDGEIGSIDQFLFDDEHWTIRHLVADTGGWLTGRLLLISPHALSTVDWDAQTLATNLTRQQIKESPDIVTDQPVSRQQEAEYNRLLRLPAILGWAWGLGSRNDPDLVAYPGGWAPVSVTPPPTVTHQKMAAAEHGDQHLRSTRAVTSYTTQAHDSDIGHVEDFIIDDETWAIRYMVVDTKNWWSGKKVLVAPSWITAVSWYDRSVAVDLTRQAIKRSPEYEPSTLLNRDYETRLYHHYERRPYWEARQRP